MTPQGYHSRRQKTISRSPCPCRVLQPLRLHRQLSLPRSPDFCHAKPQLPFVPTGRPHKRANALATADLAKRAQKQPSGAGLPVVCILLHPRTGRRLTGPRAPAVWGAKVAYRAPLPARQGGVFRQAFFVRR